MEPRGIRNNNPFNIRKGNNWKGERPVQTDKAFEEFESMAYGIRAGLKLIRNKVSGFGGKRPRLNTIRKLIYSWAPPSENQSEKYLEIVCRHVGKASFTIIRDDDMDLICHIGQAMCFVETGVMLDIELFKSAWFLK